MAYKRVRRLAHAESCRRSDLNETRLMETLQAAGVAQLSGAEEVWSILDTTDLRKPYAEQMEGLMQVRDLDGKLVPGYRVLTVLGITPGAGGLLYHRLFSSQEPGFESEPAEYQKAIRSVGTVLAKMEPSPKVTWILDRAFDDEADWGGIWAQKDHLLVRLRHLDRIIEAPCGDGGWRTTKVEAYGYKLLEIARAKTKLKVAIGRQKRARLQEVTVILYAGPMRVRYREGRRKEQEPQTREVWLMRVQVLGSNARWWLMTDQPLKDPEAARRAFLMYRMRWAVEDAFKFIKQTVGREEVQVISLDAVRFLVAMAAVAAVFLFECGVTLEWDAVRLLARLGGWVPRKNSKPGKIILGYGLRRLLDMVSIRTALLHYMEEYGQLPPQIAAFLPDDFW